MAIPSRQIGWSTKSNLLWEISKQLEALTGVIGRNIPTTTTTTTIRYYYYSGDNCINPLFSQIIRSLVSLSTNDVVLTDDGVCYTINSTYVGPDYSVEYVSTETCFTAPCPTTTTTTSSTTTTTSTTSTTTTTPPPPTLEWYEVTECYTTNVINSVDYNIGTFQLNDSVTYYLGGDWTITNILYTDPGGAQYGLSNLFSTGCPTTTTTTTPAPPPPPVTYYYNVTGYSCGTPCNNIGPFTAQSTTPLVVGLFYNNPENRAYSFEILEEIAPTLGGYDLTGELGYATCTDACP